jgi:hypothetical protein
MHRALWLHVLAGFIAESGNDYALLNAALPF